MKYTFKSVKNKTISQNTIKKYIGYFEDFFLLSSAYRYDIKGKRYIDTSLKYYLENRGENKGLNKFFSWIEER